MAVNTPTVSEPTKSKSSHVSDPALQPFLQSAFDPADYLNATLPALSLSSHVSRPLKQTQTVSLADLSSQTQDLLSQLNAHTTRLSSILTQLTDDILRSGGRLAYEVEVLRGETVGLTDTLTDTVKDDVRNFLPGGITLDTYGPKSPGSDRDGDEDDEPEKSREDEGAEEEQTERAQDTTPEYITQLRTLTLVRSRLETVIKIFGEAMHWTLPPTEVSLTSSLISVSAPEPGTDGADREKRGKEFANSLRSEISDLITGSEDAASGAEAAEVRIQALRDLAVVWKGTAEEKARTKFIDGLVKLAEEKQKALESSTSQRQRNARSGNIQKPLEAPAQKSSGFLDNLQRIRENIYRE